MNNLKIFEVRFDNDEYEWWAHHSAEEVRNIVLIDSTQEIRSIKEVPEKLWSSLNCTDHENNNYTFKDLMTDKIEPFPISATYL